jgi:hypothetical protein
MEPCGAPYAELGLRLQRSIKSSFLAYVPSGLQPRVGAIEIEYKGVRVR